MPRSVPSPLRGAARFFKAGMIYRIIERKKPTTEKIERQLEHNFQRFSEVNFNEADRGKCALVLNGELMEALETSVDDYTTGMKLYEYQEFFPTQEVMQGKTDLGCMNHALCAD